MELFFIRIGTESDITAFLGKLVIKLSMRLYTGIEYLKQLKVMELFRLADELVEVLKEEKESMDDQ